ncbi:hypothetical protein D3C85_1085280 [compost metagenome]
MGHQDLPVEVHLVQHGLPVDGVGLLEDDVVHIGPVIAIAILDEDLGQDQGRGRGDGHLVAVDRDPVLAKPAVRHRDGPVRHGEDDVEEVLVVLPHLGDPALVLDIRPIAAGLEVGEDTRVVAGFAEDVQVLGRTADAGIGRDRIGA